MGTHAKLGLLLALVALAAGGISMWAWSAPSATSDDMVEVHFKGTVEFVGEDPGPLPYWNVRVQEVIGPVGPPWCETVDVYGPSIQECYGEWYQVPHDDSALGTGVEVIGYYNPPYQVFLCGAEHFIRPLASPPTPCPTVTPAPTTTPQPTPPPTTTPEPPTTPTPTPTPTTCQMHYCPHPGQWSVATWSCEGTTPIADALAYCSQQVEAAYRLDPDTQDWTRYFRDHPEINTLSALNDGDGIIALGGGFTAVSFEDSEALQAAGDGMLGCPQPGKWAISVWTGAGGTSTTDAIAGCPSALVTAAYGLDPQTQTWQRYFEGRAEINDLLALDSWQGIMALGSTEVPPSPTPSPEPTQTPAPTATPTPAPTVAPTPSPTSTPSSYTGTLTVDRGTGATYSGGEDITVCYSLAPQTPFYFELFKKPEGGSWTLVDAWNDDGDGWCFPATVSPAELGRKDLRAEFWVSGQKVAEASTYIIVVE